MTNLVIVKFRCPHCLEIKEAVRTINKFLPENKQIKLIDNIIQEELGLVVHPIVEMFDDKTFTGYPFVYINNTQIETLDFERNVVAIVTALEEDLLISKYELYDILKIPMRGITI